VDRQAIQGLEVLRVVVSVSKMLLLNVDRNGGTYEGVFRVGTLNFSLHLLFLDICNPDILRKSDSPSSKPYGEFRSEQHMKSQFLLMHQMISYTVEVHDQDCQSKLCNSPEMEFLNGIFNQGFLS
jgi:hypothetical protein